MGWNKGIKIASFALIAAILLGAASCIRTEYVYVDENGNQFSDPSQVNRLAINLPDKPSSGDPNLFEGTWSAPLKSLQSSGERMVEISAGSTRSIFNVNRDQISGLPIASDAAGPISFTVKRRYGTINLEGKVEDRRVSGSARFIFDPEYLKQISEYTGTTIGPDNAYSLMTNELPVEYVRALHDGGLTFKLDDVLRLRRSGVQSQYAIDLKRAGYDLSADQIVKLRNSGVDPSYAAALKRGGFDLEPQEIIRLRNSGVDSTYAVDMRSAGIAKEPSEIIRLRNSGIDTHYARALSDAGMKLSVDDLVRLRNSGVNSDYAIALHKAGYDLEVRDMVRLRNAGVDASYATALVVPGKENLSVDEIIRLRQRGVDIETIQKLRRQ